MDIERRLFIGNLPSGVDENLIRNRFSKYGKVLGVELKHRKANGGSQDDEILSTFAFIDLSTKKEKLDICLRKLSRKKWDGQEIRIDFAKESVLSRLERERKELSLGDKSINVNKSPGIRDVAESSVLLNGDRNHYVSSVADLNGEKVKDNKKIQYTNNKRKLEIDIQHNQDKIKRNSELMNEYGISVENVQPSSSSQLPTPEQRRLKSLEEKMKLLTDRKLAVKAALSCVDSANKKNKIIFNDDDDNNDADGDHFSKRRSTDLNGTKNRMHDKSQIESQDSSNSARSKKDNYNLFNDSDDSEEEVSNSRFELKEHFDGKKGQKLLKLQSKYGNDSRFALDRRFEESSSSDEENDRGQDKDKETGKEVIDEDSDKIYVNKRGNGEINRQLEILQNVVGHQIIKPQSEDIRPKKQKPGASVKGNQLCVRFDPTIAEHEKFVVKPPPEVETKISKKKKSKNAEENVESDQELDKSDSETSKPISNVEVSKETYYEVASDLKERLKSSGTGFSLSQLFNSDEKNRKEVDDVLSSKKSKQRDSIFNKQSLVTEKKSNDEIDSERVTAESKTSGLSSLWKESFFFKFNDGRFQEGADFFMRKSKNEDFSRNFTEKRRELRLTVKNKMKRVMRKDNMFKKKIGGGFPPRTKKFGGKTRR